MTPFLHFRTWLRRGPTGERVLAGVSAVLVLVLVAWALVPLDDDDPNETGVAAGAPGSETVDVGEGSGGTTPTGEPAAGESTGDGTTGSGSGGGASGGGASGGGTSVGGSPSSGGAGTGQNGVGADRCANLRATDQGVTDKEIFVAVTLINLGGDVGNETFGIRPDLEAVTQAAAEGVNADGGVACRKLRVKTYRVNPLNSNEQRARCLEVAADKPFAVIDFAGYLSSAARSCFPQNKLPFLPALPVTDREIKESHPYMAYFSSTQDRAVRSWVYDAAERGLFDKSKGFAKLGLLMTACEPEINDQLRRDLQAVGVGGDQVSAFTLSCTPVAAPNQISQAALQHRQDGATHVFFAASQANAASYVQNADRVQWKPKYLGSDFGAVTSPTTEGQWSDGFDGAIALTSGRTGEYNSGMVPPLAEKCQEWYKRANVRPPETDADGAMAACTLFRFFQAAGNAAGPNLVRTSLVEGVARIGLFQSPTHLDSMFDRPGKITGGDVVRAIQWHVDCHCFRVLDRDPKPAR